MAHDVHQSEKKLQITKVDCKKPKYELFCHDQLHISTFPTLAWMKDGKIEKTYASHKISVESLKNFVFQNIHDAHLHSANSKSAKHLQAHPKDVHHAHKHKHLKSLHEDHHHNHEGHHHHGHDHGHGHRHNFKDLSSHESDSHGNLKSQHHHIDHHHDSIKKPHTHHKHDSSEHHIKLKHYHSDELHHHMDGHHDMHDHPQNDQHHIDHISKVHHDSKVNPRKHAVEKEIKAVKSNNHNHATHNERLQIVAPEIIHDKKHHKTLIQNDKAKANKNTTKKNEHLAIQQKKADKHHHQFKIMKMNPHNFKSSLNPDGITFVIFYGEKTKNPANNKRIRFIKHVAMKYLKSDNSLGEVNCKLVENADLCRAEKFVADPMVNVYKKGILFRHNYHFHHHKKGKV